MVGEGRSRGRLKNRGLHGELTLQAWAAIVRGSNSHAVSCHLGQTELFCFQQSKDGINTTGRHHELDTVKTQF